MRGVLVDDDDAVAGLGDDVGLVHLRPRRAEGVVQGVDHASGGLFDRLILNAGGDLLQAGQHG